MIKTVIRAFGYGRTSQELSDRELNTALKHPIVDGKKVAQATPVVATVVTPSSPPRPQPPSPLTRFNQNTIDERIVIPPHQILSDYDLVKIVGESKTATITLAIHRPTQEKVAIKRYQKSERSTHIYREASIHAKAHHPQIAQLRAFAEGERDIFLVQEYIAGGELFDAVTPDVGCKPEHFRSYALQLCQAVSYLHSKNIAHRDLKPENVMLSGDQKTLKVIDFGLSEYCVDNVKYKQHIGTVPYMAVELFRPTASGYLAMDLKAVDVWAVGIILFTMACGRFAWAEATSRSPEFRRYRANDFSQAPWTNIARDQPVVYELLINMLALDAAQRWTIDQCIEYIETKWAEPVTPKRMRNLHNLRINIAKKHVTGAPDTPLSPLALSPQQRLTSSASALFDYRSPATKAA